MTFDLQAHRKRKIDPKKIYRAFQPASTIVDGRPFAITTETRLRGDHPAVRNCGREVFIEADTPDDELPGVFHFVSPPPPDPNPIPILETRHRAKRRVSVDVDGDHRSVRKGELLEPGDLVVGLVPDAFETITVERAKLGSRPTTIASRWLRG